MSTETKQITLTVTGYDASRIEGRVAELLAERAAETMTEKIDAAVSEAVESTLRRLVEEKLRPEVERVVNEGWQQTNNYGEPTGARLTLAQRVSKIIDERDYQGSRVERLAKEAIDQALKGPLAKDIEETRAKFKALVDETLKAKFTGAMRDALGLKS